MKFKSAVITAGSGSVGGLTVSHNSAGMYFRGRSTPTDPSSLQQNLCRNALSFLSNYWLNTLTAGQRTEWDTYAGNVTILDKFGDAIYISGFNHFLRSNTFRKRIGIAVIADGPANFNKGEFTSPQITCSEAAQTVSVAFNAADDWANEDDAWLAVYSSRPQNLSINFFKGPYQLAGYVQGIAAGPAVSPLNATSPFAFTAGQKIFARINVVRADGRLSNSFSTFCIGVA